MIRRRGLSDTSGASRGDAAGDGPDLTRWREADRIEIRSNLNMLLRRVPPEAVRPIVERLAGLGGGWTVPEKGVPVARVRVELYAGDRFLGSLGIGGSFVSVHQMGTFWSRASDPAFKAEVLAMAGLDTPET